MPPEAHRLRLAAAHGRRLEGGMADPVLRRDLAQRAQCPWPVGQAVDADVGGEGRALGADRPDVQVVHFADAGHPRQLPAEGVDSALTSAASSSALPSP